MPDIQLKSVSTDNFASIVMVVACFDDDRGYVPLDTFLRAGLSEDEIWMRVEDIVRKKVNLESPEWVGLRDIAVLITLWGWNNPL